MVLVDEGGHGMRYRHLDKPQDLRCVADLLEYSQNGEDRAVDHHSAQHPHDGGATAQTGPESAAEEPDRRVDGEHSPGIHFSNRRLHAGGQPSDVVPAFEPPSPAVGHACPGRIEGLREHVSDENQTDPENGKPNQTQDGVDAKRALGGIFIFILPGEQGENKTDQRETQNGKLRPNVPSADRPRKKREMDDRDDDEGAFLRVDGNRHALLAAKRLQEDCRLVGRSCG